MNTEIFTNHTEYLYDYEQFLDDWNIWDHGFTVPVTINSATVYAYVTPKKIRKLPTLPECEGYIYTIKYKLGKKKRRLSFTIVFSQLGVFDISIPGSKIIDTCARFINKSLNTLLFDYRFKPTMREEWIDYETGYQYSWWLPVNREICEKHYIL